MKKVVKRMCIACNTKKEKKDLLRIVIDKGKNISIDETGKLSGRGIYICRSIDCLNKVKENKKMEQVLGINLDKKFYEKLEEVIINK